MLKRFMLMAVSAAALIAFAAPAAQASGALITNAEGEAAKTLTALSENTTTTLTVGSWECRTRVLHMDVTTNAETTAHAHGPGTMEGTVAANTHTGHCGVGTTKIPVHSININSLHLTDHGGETTGTVNFKYTFTFNFHCTFDGTGVPVQRTSTSTINVNGPLKRDATSSSFCPSEGSIKGDFTVIDESGSLAHIH